MAKTGNLDRLQAAYDTAARELEQSSAAADDATRQLAECEQELQHNQQILDALEGRNPDYREQLLRNPEFETLNVDELAAKVRSLWKTIHKATAASKQAAAHLDSTRAAEKKAFYELQNLRHREVVRELLKAEIKVHDLLNQERAVQNVVMDREGTSSGCSLPPFARPSYDAAITHARLRDAVAAGYLDKSETGSFKV